MLYIYIYTYILKKKKREPNQNHYSLLNYLYWVWEVFFNLVKKKIIITVDHVYSLGMLTEPFSIYFNDATFVGMIEKFKYFEMF